LKNCRQFYHYPLRILDLEEYSASLKSFDVPSPAEASLSAQRGQSSLTQERTVISFLMERIYYNKRFSFNSKTNSKSSWLSWLERWSHNFCCDLNEKHSRPSKVSNHEHNRTKSFLTAKRVVSSSLTEDKYVEIFLEILFASSPKTPQPQKLCNISIGSTLQLEQ
jgi:hypothetical protein